MTAHFHQPLLFEMLRSFTVLAKHLNLSHAVAELNSTRQTVRRHIAQLEEMKGGDLFLLKDRQYALTDLGQKVLPEAEDLIARAEGWMRGHSSIVNGLQRLQFTAPDGWFLHQQQHPLGRVFKSKSDVLRRVLSAWAESGGQIESEAMESVRKYLMVFRRVGPDWLCVEIGEESSFVSWFGKAKAQSSIGRSTEMFPKSGSFGYLVGLAYQEVEASECLRLDHTLTRIPRTDGGEHVTLSYERLLGAARFPDDSLALISAVRRTHDVDLPWVNDELRRDMPKELVM